jgi:hypothetical protein
LRYLVSSSRNEIEIGADQDVYVMDDTVRVVADVRDKYYNPITDVARDRAHHEFIRRHTEVPLKFSSINEANVYKGVQG